MSNEKKSEKRSVFSSETVIAIQLLYIQERRQGGIVPKISNEKSLELNPGWGGRGR
jgi:hypothetical protein